MQDFAQPQLQPYTHPCIIELPGGYRVYGQDRDRLNEGLSVLLENGIQFPSPNLVQHYAEPPPRYLVPADSSSSSSISTQAVTATPAPVATSEEAFKPFGYYRDLYLLRQDRRNINDETYASDAFITELAQDIFEDKSPKLLTPEDIEVFLDALEHLPLRAKKKLGAGMTYRSLIAQSKREKMETIAKNTQGKHIANFRAFIHWLMDAKVIIEDPTCAVNIADYKPKTKTKVAFSEEDVQEITHHKHEAANTKPQQHWVPLMGLYSGLRLNEMAQLYAEDIVQVGGIWCFHVSSDRAGQSVKSESSVRYVPMRSELIELGFLDYVDEVRGKGFDHLFPGQTWGKNGPGGNISISLNKTHLRKRCGIKDPRKTIGCLRHTFATWSAQSGVLPRATKRILGHAEEKSILHKHYVDPAEVPECKMWMDEIEFPPLFAKRYVPGRFDKHFAAIKAKEEREGRARTTNGKLSRKDKTKEKAKKEAS